ncbi:ribonuclease H-like domain-containing protein [Thermodesulfobacteriota bacterium]
MDKKFKDKKYVVFDIETSGLNPWYGDRITCICAKDSDAQIFALVDEDEQTIIRSFLGWLVKRKRNKYFLITQNGKEFDIPFILSRITLKMNLDEKTGLFILNYEHLDLIKLTKKPISLNAKAELLGCTPKSGSSENAIKLWNEGRYDELKDYCVQDVDTTEEIYLKWCSLK